jgi:uroporphyrinogen decarboxylase
MRAPDFNNLLAVLKREKPSRPTLFEFFMNDKVYESFAGPEICAQNGPLSKFRILIHGFKNAGYDYATIPCWMDDRKTLRFPSGESVTKSTRSLNDGAVIVDRATFESYPWMTIDPAEYAFYGELASILPEGMKLVGSGPGGVLENAISLVGYERLCCMAFEDEQLVSDIFEAIGSRFVEHYRILGTFDTIGALISNDDWGFKTQTMLSPDMMRKFVFPWHKRIVEAIHASGKPAILHSCGCLDEVIDDIVDDMKYDGKHSYEDIIRPVEQAYEKWGGRIAILGGIDLDFVVRSTPEAVYNRAKKLIAQTSKRGGYGLGSGNSIPDYVPMENYRAMLRAIN